MMYIPFPIGRVCHICDEWKPRHQLKKNKRMPFGAETTCLSCARQMNKIWTDAHQSQVQASRKKWIDKNPGKTEAAIHAWALKNPDKVRENYNRNSKKHPETNRAKTLRRASRKRDLPCTFTRKEWQRCLSYWNHVCAYCENPPSSAYKCKKLAQEHYIPQTPAYELDEPNPGYVATNIVPSCKACNSRKWNSDPRSWAILYLGKETGEIVLNRIQEYFKWIRDQDSHE